jgi:RecA-family ATPase
MIAPLPPAIEAIHRNGAAEGERNTQLFKLACQWRDQGLTEFDATTNAEEWAYKVGLSQNEAVGAVRSAFSKPAREAWRPKAKYGYQNGAIVREDLPVPQMPKSVEAQPVEKFLAEAFELGESINICRSIKDGDRERPDGTGETRKREEWLELYKGDGLKEWQGSAVGVYVSINPNNGKGRKGEHVTKWRHVLIEFDDSTLDEQWKIIKKSGLPTTCIIKSGSRSLHAWVKIDAANEAEFAERVDFIFKHLQHTKLDSSTKDAGRLSRLPGAMRTATGNQQELVECGTPSISFLQWKERILFGDIPEPYKWDELLNFKETEDPTQLLGKRWICRGGSALWVGSSGLGKSVLCMQAAITWAIAESFFGINPHGNGLKSLIIQAENDEGDVAESIQGVFKAMNLTEEQRALVMANVAIVRDCTSTGEKFVDRVRRLVEKHKPDLVWIDPLLAFIGGDLSSQETASAFLRNMLNPLSLSAGFAWMLIHHTPKPLREGNGYQGHDKAYSGFGSSELTNWARSVLTLAPCGDDAEGKRIYRLEVTKRGKRSNLNSKGIIAQNAVQPHVSLRHSDVGLAWIEADEPERKTAGRPEIVVNFEDYKKAISKGISAGDLQSYIRNKSKVGHTKSRDLTAAWEQEGLIKNTGTEKAKKYVLNEDQK